MVRNLTNQIYCYFSWLKISNYQFNYKKINPNNYWVFSFEIISRFGWYTPCKTACGGSSSSSSLSVASTSPTVYMPAVGRLPTVWPPGPDFIQERILLPRRHVPPPTHAAGATVTIRLLGAAAPPCYWAASTGAVVHAPRLWCSRGLLYHSTFFFLVFWKAAFAPEAVAAAARRWLRGDGGAAMVARRWRRRRAHFDSLWSLSRLSTRQRLHSSYI